MMVLIRRELDNPKNTLLAMLGGKVTSLPNHIQSVYVQNILKILNIILKDASQELALEVSYTLILLFHNMT